MAMRNFNVNTILFDLDGVVIDSEALHLQAMGLTLQQHSIDYTKSMLNDFIGKSDDSFFQWVCDTFNGDLNKAELIEEKNVFFEDLLNRLNYMDGFKEFIQLVKAKNIATALVTSSSLFSVKKVDDLINMTRYFEVIVTEEDTEEHKPHPAPYLLALDKTGAERESALIIEDSINGIISGKKAGCMVAGLTSSFDADRLKNAGADVVVADFEELANIIGLQ